MITSSRNLILLCLVATLTLGNRFFVNAKKLDHDSLIRVYDNVMPPNTAEWLHHACLQLGQGVSVFQYPLENPSRHTSIEQFLDLLLKELYPSEKYYVEYWKRSEWHHILAHADMDGKYIKKWCSFIHSGKRSDINFLSHVSICEKKAGKSKRHNLPRPP